MNRVLAIQATVKGKSYVNKFYLDEGVSRKEFESHFRHELENLLKDADFELHSWIEEAGTQ